MNLSEFGTAAVTATDDLSHRVVLETPDGKRHEIAGVTLDDSGDAPVVVITAEA